MTAQPYQQVPSNIILGTDDHMFINSTPIDCNTVDANDCPWNNQPTKYLAVNFHYFCRPDGTGNFNENNDGSIPFNTNMNAYIWAEQVLKEANEQLRENSPGLNAPAGTPVCKINVQLSLKGVYVHSGEFTSDVVNVVSTTPYTTEVNSSSSMNDVVFNPTYYVNGGNEINCFFYPITKGEGVIGDAYLSGYTNFGGNYIVCSGAWENYTTITKGQNNPDTWYLKAHSRLILHEIFHTFGLVHPQDGSDACNDTPDGLDCWQWVENQENPCNNPINLSNNLMDYNGDVTTWSLSPCQICIAHQSMEGSSQVSMQNYVSFVGNCQRPVALLYGSPCAQPYPIGSYPDIIIDGSATTYETSYVLTVVQVNHSTGQTIPNTQRSNVFTGEIGKVNLTTALSYPFEVGKSYRVTLRANNSCSEPDIISKVIRIGSCGEVQRQENGIRQFRVYPNPITDIIHIEYDLETPENTQIDLISLVTEYSYPLKTSSSESAGSHYFSTEIPNMLPDGSYAIRISTARDVITQPIFIQH
jgi:hypothetical protein